MEARKLGYSMNLCSSCHPGVSSDDSEEQPLFCLGQKLLVLTDTCALPVLGTWADRIFQHRGAASHTGEVNYTIE